MISDIAVVISQGNPELKTSSGVIRNLIFQQRHQTLLSGQCCDFKSIFSKNRINIIGFIGLYNL
jgi:hypothetical protein